MATTTTAGVYMIAAEHGDAIQRFAADSEFAKLANVARPAPDGAGAEFVERATAQRLAGEAYWHAIVDRNDAKGVSALLGPYTNTPTLLVWIDPAWRRRGYGTLAMRLGLEFAFRNLQLAHVVAAADRTDDGQVRTLTKFGFVAADAAPPHGPGEYRLTRDDWIAHRDRPALALLHPALRTILDAELAAGNEVAETGGGWPDPDSVFIRLRDPFRTKPSPLPPGVVYTEPNDPHWWKADYATVSSPRHILAC
jgi:RimJ/RimL family protein N-acetyltransferase